MTTVPDLIVTTTMVPKTTLPPPKVEPPPFAPAPPAAGRLKVLEAYTRDVGRGVARIDYDAMDALDVSTGDVIRIQAVDKDGIVISTSRWTVAKVLPLYPSDEGRSIIRMDGLIRNNAMVAINNLVMVSKVKCPLLSWAKVKPLERTPPIEGHFLADTLENVPMTLGDNVLIPYFGGRLTYQVVGLDPTPIGMVASKTKFEIVDDPKPKKRKLVCFEQEEAKINARILEGWHVSEWLIASSWKEGGVEVMVPTAVMERTVIVEDGKAESKEASKA